MRTKTSGRKRTKEEKNEAQKRVEERKEKRIKHSTF